MAEIIEIHRSSIFDSTCQTIVNTVNCVGIMGRGLALEFKMRFPEMFEQYRSVCDRKLLRPGNLLLFKGSNPWILNFPTKDHWKYPSKMEYLETGLSKFAETYIEKGITSIAFPKLGTSAGKLEWEDVRNLMYRLLSPLKNLQIEIYHFDPDSKDTYFDKLYQKLHRLSIEDYIRLLGLKKRQAILLQDGISSGAITTMIGIQSIDGVGEKSIDAIYNFVRNSSTRVVTASEDQPSLF